MWNKIKEHKFQIIILSLFGFFIYLVVYYLSLRYWNFANEIKDKDSPLNLKNIAIGIAALATAIFTWWKNVINTKQTNAALEDNKIKKEQIDLLNKQTEFQFDQSFKDDYDKAIELLNGANDIIKRKAGAAKLKDLAVSSPNHTQKCLDALCSLNEIWMPNVLKQNKIFFTHGRKWQEDLTEKVLTEEYNLISDNYSKLISDISLSQSVIRHLESIISAINSNPSFEESEFDLSGKYLCNIILSNIDFSKFKVYGSYFTGCMMTKSKFEKEKFMIRTHFEGSYIYNCDFQKVDLIEVDFEGSLVSECNLEGARLAGANLIGTNFEGSNLKNAQLMKAKTKGVKFENANIEGVNFNGSDYQ